MGIMLDCHHILASYILVMGFILSSVIFSFLKFCMTSICCLHDFMVNSYTRMEFLKLCASHRSLCTLESCQSYNKSCFACVAVYMSVTYPREAGTSHSRPKCIMEG